MGLLFASLLALQVSGNQIVDENGAPFVVKGVSIADPEHINQKRPGVATKGLMALAKKRYGVNTIRIPMHPETDGHTGFFRNPNEYLANHLLPAIEEAKALGLYVIVDYHKVANWDVSKKEAIRFWKIVAPILKDYPHTIVEIFNEPIYPMNFRRFRSELVLPLVKTIRKELPDTLLLVGSPEWSTNPQGFLEAPVTGTNIAYVAHVYPGHKPEHWKERYEPVTKRYPLVITEWGFEKGASSPVDGTEDAFGEPFLSWMEDLGLGSVAWLFDNTWEGRLFGDDWTEIASPNGAGPLLRKHWSKEIARSPRAARAFPILGQFR